MVHLMGGLWAWIQLPLKLGVFNAPLSFAHRGCCRYESPFFTDSMANIGRESLCMPGYVAARADSVRATPASNGGFEELYEGMGRV